MTLGMITAAERRHTGIDYIVSPVFEALGIPHMFTTRYGGVSEGCFESLNFTVGRGKVRDDHSAVLANAALAAGVFRMLPDQVVWPRQEHTAVAARIDEKNPSAPEHGCDALVTSQRGKLLAVVTADCVPVLLYDTRADVCAAVHSGWRGTLDGVAGAALLGAAYAMIIAGINPAQGHTPLMYALICAVGALISMVGDLAASAIKRNKGIKDYGTLIPGHGGILDRFDSVIFTAPFIYFLAEVLI